MTEESAVNFCALREELTSLARFITYKVFDQPRYELADDIVGHVLLNLSKFRGRSQFSTWVYKVSENYALSELRKEAARKEVSLEGLEEVIKCPSNLICMLTLAASTSLSALDQEILLKFHQEGSFQSLAGRLGISRATLWRRLQAIRRQLQPK